MQLKAMYNQTSDKPKVRLVLRHTTHVHTPYLSVEVSHSLQDLEARGFLRPFSFSRLSTQKRRFIFRGSYLQLKCISTYFAPHFRLFYRPFLYSFIFHSFIGYLFCLVSEPPFSLSLCHYLLCQLASSKNANQSLLSLIGAYEAPKAWKGFWDLFS